MPFSLIRGIMSLFLDRMGINWSGRGGGGGESRGGGDILLKLSKQST